MVSKKVYLDTCVLVPCFIWMIERKIHNQGLFEKAIKSIFIKVKKNHHPTIRFFEEHKDIQTYISLGSLAEIYRVLLHDDRFKRYELRKNQVDLLIKVLIQMLGLNIIFQQTDKGKQFNTFSTDVLEFSEKNCELADGIHLDIAKANELAFITNEEGLGRLKDAYENIMTAEKYFKQF